MKNKFYSYYDYNTTKNTAIFANHKFRGWGLFEHHGLSPKLQIMTTLIRFYSNCRDGPSREAAWFLPCMVLMHSKPWKSHNFIVMSAEQDARSLPVWSKEMSCTESVCPLSVAFKVTSLVVPDLVKDTRIKLLNKILSCINTLQLNGNKRYKENIFVLNGMKDKHTCMHEHTICDACHFLAERYLAVKIKL